MCMQAQSCISCIHIRIYLRLTDCTDSYIGCSSLDSDSHYDLCNLDIGAYSSSDPVDQHDSIYDPDAEDPDTVMQLQSVIEGETGRESQPESSEEDGSANSSKKSERVR